MSVTSARLKAREILDQLNVKSVPVPVEQVARHLDIGVSYITLDSELSGMSFIKDGYRHAVVNKAHHLNRRRFTLAHEIAHHVLDDDLLKQGVHVDKAILKRDALAASGVDKRERAANAFAAELLMPSFLLKSLLAEGFDFNDEEFVEKLAVKCKVSVASLQFRLMAPEFARQSRQSSLF